MRWRVEARPAVIDGTSCLVLRSSPEPHYLWRLYLDPARDYVPLRCVVESRGRTVTQVEMRYERTEPPLWFPSSWTSTYFYFGDTRSFERSENDLEAVTLGGPMPDETFTIDYPPGTDLTTEGIPGLATRLIVAEDGEWVPLRRAAAEASADGSRLPWLLAAAGAAVLGAALLLWRRAAAA